MATERQKRACVSIFIRLTRKGQTIDRAIDAVHKSTGFNRDMIARIIKERTALAPIYRRFDLCKL